MLFKNWDDTGLRALFREAARRDPDTVAAFRVQVSSPRFGAGIVENALLFANCVGGLAWWGKPRVSGGRVGRPSGGLGTGHFVLEI